MTAPASVSSRPADPGHDADGVASGVAGASAVGDDIDDIDDIDDDGADEVEGTPGVGQALAVLDAAVSVADGQRREGQRTMAAAVAEALLGDRHLLVQAGTGTGKSWAYLAPALVAAAQRRDTVVVATSTLALQAQLVRRDLPRLADAVAAVTGRRPRWAVLKGRHNYLCRHRLSGGAEPGDGTEALWSDPPSGGARTALEEQVARLRAWAEETPTGDRDDLDVGVWDRAWRAVAVTARECLGAARCPVAGDCFSEAARRDAREADVVVTNHALLAIDAAGGRAGMPEHGVVVVDEAHDLVDRVTSSLSVELAPAAVLAAAGAARGVGADPADLESAARSLERALDEVRPGRLDRGLPAAVADALALVATSARTARRSAGTESGGTEPKVQAARAALAELADVAVRLSGPRWATGGGDGDGDSAAGTGLVAADGGPADDGDSPAHEDSPSHEGGPGDDPGPALAPALEVLWVSDAEGRGRVLHGAPLSVASLLRHRLFGTRTTVLTSATLVSGGGFEALARRVGLRAGRHAGPDAAPDADGEDWTSLDVGSPFDYPRQGILYVASRLPPPGRDEHAGPVHDEIERLLLASRGGVLGLFSSRRAAVAAAEEMRRRTDLPVLCQGDDAAAALVREFAGDDASSLFGTLGLWQGVDVPGGACRLVLIDRVPFPRPDDPLMSARAAAADAAGGNGFRDVSVAHAATLLAQGAGRLIRGPRDRGVVAVLDSRLVTRRYGVALLDAMPPLWRTTDPEVVAGALSRIAPPPR